MKVKKERKSQANIFDVFHAFEVLKATQNNVA